MKFIIFVFLWDKDELVRETGRYEQQLEEEEE
jgi:hypothetical protein